jgi:hypothetical protein
MTNNFVSNPLVCEQLPQEFCIFSHQVKTGPGFWVSQKGFRCHED